VHLLLACLVGVAGLAFGSFLNVCISRIPCDESIVSPPSHCLHCGRPIRWYHNVPVTSYVLLKGRCADCGNRISPRYPAVELLTAALFLACFAKFGLSLALVKFCVFSFLVVGLIFMDAETGLLPHEFTYPGIALGLLFAWLVPVDSSGTLLLAHMLGLNPTLNATHLSLLDAVIAAAFGAAFFYVIWAAYYLLRKRHGLGFGDIALIALAGVFLGLKLTLFVLFVSPLIGTAFAVMLLIRNSAARANTSASHDETPTTRELLRTGQIPFGVFLGACSLLAVFWGEAAWNQYLRWISGS
jgi:leader peptidase (prepilin peptidase)/N-methyltransferase